MKRAVLQQVYIFDCGIKLSVDAVLNIVKNLAQNLNIPVRSQMPYLGLQQVQVVLQALGFKSLLAVE